MAKAVDGIRVLFRILATPGPDGRELDRRHEGDRLLREPHSLAPHPPDPQLSFQRTPVSLAIRFATALPVISPEGRPPPGAIHWPTM